MMMMMVTRKVLPLLKRKQQHELWYVSEDEKAFLLCFGG